MSHAPVVAVIRAKIVRVRACVVVNDGGGEHDITATMRFGTSLAEPESPPVRSGEVRLRSLSPIVVSLPVCCTPRPKGVLD